MLAEKGRKLLERDELHPVVEIHMTGAGDDEEFLWLTGKAVSLFAELSRVGELTCDEKHWTRRDRLDVLEWVEVHELHVAAERRMRGELWRTSRWRVFTSWSAVELIKLPLNGMGIVIQLMIRPAGVFGLTAGELD